ncbi:MAG: histidine kinase [Candidatus Promineifilaceae bacterium]|nr:histidine kinase [Candidatus Promineifilaceae bacterium]
MALVILVLSVLANLLAATRYLQGSVTAVELPLWPRVLSVVGFLAFAAAAVFSFILAAVLFRRRPQDRMTLFLAYFLLVYGTVAAGPLASLETIWPGLQDYTWSVVQPLLFAPLLVVFLSTFPNGRFEPGWARWLVALTFLYAPISVGFTTNVASGWKMADVIGALLWFGLIFAGLGTQIYRYRHISSVIERQQTKWIIYGFSLSLLFIFLASAGALELFFVEISPLWRMLLGSLGWGLAIAVLPLSLAVAVLRYRLYDIDNLINRTLVYGALTVSVVSIYALAVGALSVLFQAQGNTLIALLATALVAVLFQPLRERLQRAVNRLFYGQRDDPLQALAQLGRRLEAVLAPELVLPVLVETIAQSLKLPYVAISLRSGEEFEIVARWGDAIEDAIQIPLIYQGKTVGQLIAGLRGQDEPFSAADRQLLDHIAHQAGPSVYAVQLTQDLRRSRVRLITAREEERRRLRRDLHDGLGPVLASQGLKIAAASQLLQENPARAQSLLEELADQNEATVTEIRRLVYDLRPAALDDLGLVGAVREYASALRDDGLDSPRLQVEVRAPGDGLPPLPAAIEVAAYRISTEALTNVARHAQARRTAVTFTVFSSNHEQELQLEIVDDGLGLPVEHRSGVGLVSMRERAEEVGGDFLIDSPPGRGTRVLARLPLAEEA